MRHTSHYKYKKEKKVEQNIDRVQNSAWCDISKWPTLRLCLLRYYNYNVDFQYQPDKKLQRTELNIKNPKKYINNVLV